MKRFLLEGPLILNNVNNIARLCVSAPSEIYVDFRAGKIAFLMLADTQLHRLEWSYGNCFKK